eukprot:CAMPEP_0180559264 /NCGR_PEP_ID=MMETSP1037_2-20121125/2203_1 /TAXON_ID=632150 /ORGANISM="Azadinium spinosum, Strain 3D9" /LENGTH=81 /DNA_ID=CAMNT_0022575723 /DNA_START=557 /DNA_END=802 /DNA_ORIENTATION=+
MSSMSMVGVKSYTSSTALSALTDVGPIKAPTTEDTAVRLAAILCSVSSPRSLDGCTTLWVCAELHEGTLPRRHSATRTRSA